MKEPCAPAPRRNPAAVGDGILWASEAKPKAQLGDCRSQSHEPRRVGCGNPLTGGGYITLETHDAPFFAVAEVFFRRSRLFFREAAFFSGGEGCEWRAQRATVGESGDKAENEFSGFIPLTVPRKGEALTSPPPDFLFSSIPPSSQPQKPISAIASIASIASIGSIASIHPQKKQHSLLVLPSVHTILNFATKFFEMFTKKQSEHPQKVFQVFQMFRVFQVFHVRFWTTKPPDFGPNPNKPEKSAPIRLRHLMATENTQKSNPPTGLRTRFSPVCHSHSCCSAKPTFYSFPSHWILQNKNRHLFFLLMGWNRCLL